MTAAGRPGRLAPWLPTGLAALLAVLLFGSRTAPLAAPHVCVLAPRVEVGPGGQPQAVVPLARPTLFARGAYASMRIEREGKPAWTLVSGDGGPIHGPVAWPLAPIRPGERLLLRLRPVGASAEDFATIELIGAAAARLTRTEEQIRRLGDDPELWHSAVQTALAQGDLPLMLALLFAAEGPSAADLDALRMEVFHRGCGEGKPSP